MAVTNNAKKTDAVKPGTQEPWFWIIISPLLLVLVACVITVSIAVINADDVVVGNYYKEGLAVNEVFSLANNGKNLGLAGTMIFDNKKLDVLVDLSSLKNQDLSSTSQQFNFPPQLRLALSHPAKQSKDKTIELSLQSSGIYRGSVDAALSDRWYWRLSPSIDVQEGSSQQWQLSGELIIDSTSNKTTLSF